MRRKSMQKNQNFEQFERFWYICLQPKQSGPINIKLGKDMHPNWVLQLTVLTI